MSQSNQSTIPLLVPDMPTAEELLPYLKRIDENKWYTNFGPLVQEYEASLSSWLSKRSGRDAYAVTVNSGTAALELGLSVLNLKPGAKVLVPGITFIASATAVTRMGFIPVFSDIDESSWLLTTTIARSVIEYEHIDAVMPVATFGVPHDLKAWDDFTKETGIPVLIDAAAALSSQNIGATTLCAYSLHATKSLGVGEGGVLITSNKSQADWIRMLSNFGLDNKGMAELKHGTNAKLSEYHAAVGLAQLSRLTYLKNNCSKLVSKYKLALAPFSDKISFQAGWGGSLVFTLPLRTEQPALSINQQFKRRDIQTRSWYCPPLTMHPAFMGKKKAAVASPDMLLNAEYLGCHLIGLPFHAQLSEGDFEKIIESLSTCLN